jgi:hypothetical protein
MSDRARLALVIAAARDRAEGFSSHFAGPTQLDYETADDVLAVVMELDCVKHAISSDNREVAVFDPDHIVSLHLPTRTAKALDRAGIISVPWLTKLSPAHLLDIRGFGHHSLMEVERALDKRGLRLSSYQEALERHMSDPNDRPGDFWDVSERRSLPKDDPWKDIPKDQEGGFRANVQDRQVPPER